MEKDKELYNEIIVSLIPFILVLIMEIFFKALNYGIIYFFVMNVSTLVFSFIIGYCIYGIILSLFKKTSIATIIMSILIFVILLVDQIKIVYTGEPIYFSDINFLGTISDLANIVSSNVFAMTYKYIIGLIIMFILMFLLYKWNTKNEMQIKSTKLRIAIFLICLIVLLILFVPNSYTKDFYLNLFFNTDEYKDYDSYTTNLDFYQYNTFFAGLYGTLLNNRFSEPEDYNEEELQNELESAVDEQNTSYGTPNIIVIFSETFWNIDNLEEITFDKSVLENFETLSSVR